MQTRKKGGAEKSPMCLCSINLSPDLVCHDVVAYAHTSTKSGPKQALPFTPPARHGLAHPRHCRPAPAANHQSNWATSGRQPNTNTMRLFLRCQPIYGLKIAKCTPACFGYVHRLKGEQDAIGMGVDANSAFCSTTLLSR